MTAEPDPAAASLMTPADLGGPPTRVYVVRHGETDWNVAGRIQGHTQTSLNDRGRLQARQAARLLAGRGIRHIWSSDLNRCIETAEMISQAVGVGFDTTPALRERDFGGLSGSAIAEAAKLRDAAVRTEADPTEWSGVPGVESDGRMSERLWAFVNPVVARHAGQTLLLVTHGGVLRVLMCDVLGIAAGKPWRAVLRNAAVNLFEVHAGVWRLRTFGLEPEPEQA